MRRLAGLTLLAGLAIAAPAPAAVQLAQVTTVVRPTAIAAPPNDFTRVFIAQQPGKIRVVKDGQLLETPFLDVRTAGPSTQVSDNPAAYSERGLLGLAFAPDYATSGRFYVFYTADGTGNLRVDEFRRGATADVADPATRRPIIEIPHGEAGNHNGGQLAFGPDGFLYVATGDGGQGGDPAGNGQNLDSSTPAVVNGVDHHPLLGKLLRLDPVGGTTPPGQPIAPGARPEIYAYGLRNPFRFSFDRQTGDLTIGDVGQDTIEEIDFVPAPGRGLGANFGWDSFEGSGPFPGGAPLNGTHTPPVLEHPQADGSVSITGGYVVRDPALADLTGQYVYGDYGRGKIQAATLALPQATGVRDLGLPRIDAMSTFGEDACGRIYVASLNGTVWRLSDSGQCVAPGSSPPPPAGGGGGGGPGGGASDTTAPRLTPKAAVRQRPLGTGVVRVRASCDEQCTVRVSASLRSGGKALGLRAQPRTVTLAAGATISVQLKLSAKVRRALARRLRARRKVTVRFTLDATDAAKNRTVRTATSQLIG